MLLAGCTDAAEVPTTVAHVHLTTTCTAQDQDCGFYYSDVFYTHCGTISSTAVTPTTREIEVTTSYDAENISGFVQLQYTNDPKPPGVDELGIVDHVLTDDANADVYAAYDYTLLYRITPSGEVVDIDTTKLSAASGNTLQFRYTVPDVSVQEDHVIDAPLPVRLETDAPGLEDACCSVGRPADAGVVGLVLAFGLRRRRRRPAYA